MYRFFVQVVFLCYWLAIAEIGMAQEKQTNAADQLPEKRTAESLWKTHVKTLLDQNCSKCHNGNKKSGQLDLSTSESTLQGGKKGKTVVPGEPDQSLILQLVQPDAKPHMPPGKKQLSKEDIAILKSWVERLGEGPRNDTGKKVVGKTKQASEGKSGWTPPAGSDPKDVIDRMVKEKWAELKIPTANGIDDRRFACRLYLDLVGRIPSGEELKRFEESKEPDRRDKLIDELLNSPEHAEYFGSLFDTLLMGREDDRKYEQRKSGGWNAFLEAAFRDNRPWNEVVQDILLARPENPKARGAVWFLYERKDKHQAIAEAIAPSVFGIRIECAQCHDHPLAGEIEQRHYWGLVGFFRRGKNVSTKAGARVSESAIGGFEEFTDLSGSSHPNELVFLGKPPVPENRPDGKKPQQDSNDLYVSAKKPGAPRIPKFSRRQAFVENVVKDHPLVARAMVNRLWAIMVGRGFVHPFDKMDSAHPASHPELLNWLSKDFEQSGYDVRRLVKKVATSSVYQLDSKRPAPDSDPATFAWALEKPLVAEAWTRSIAQLLRGKADEHSELIRDFRQQFPELLPEENMTRLSQTMFLSNGDSLQKFIRESHAPGHLHTRMVQAPDHRGRIEMLYQEAFARSPDETELKAAVDFLAQRHDRLSDALDMLLWAIVTSAEFRFNH